MGPWFRGLLESNFYVGYVGYVGLHIFYVGQHFTWVIIFTWVSWVKYNFAYIKIFCVGQFFCVSQIFCGGSKKYRLALSQ